MTIVSEFVKGVELLEFGEIGRVELPFSLLEGVSFLDLNAEFFTRHRIPCKTIEASEEGSYLNEEDDYFIIFPTDMVFYSDSVVITYERVH